MVDFTFAILRYYTVHSACYPLAVELGMGRIAFLFDMDGVLINSMPLHTLAWERYLSDRGITVHDLEVRMHGKRNPELVRELIAADLPEDVILEHGAAKEKLFRMLMVEELDRYRIAGIDDFLDRYRNVPKAIGSNAERANIDFTLDHLGLRDKFSVAVDGGEVERPKPFPDVYLLAAKRLGVEPQHCIVFEDSPVGAAAARAAGMRVVGVETIPTTFSDVDLVIRDFNDPRLAEWLSSQESVAASSPEEEPIKATTSRREILLAPLALLTLAHAKAQDAKYNGPVPPQKDVAYLLQANTLKPTEVVTATQSTKKDDQIFSVAGAASSVKSPLAEPIFLFASEKIRAESLGLYKFEVAGDNRQIVISKKGKGPQQFHTSIRTVAPGLYRIEAADYLENGEYCLSPEGENTAFCFAIY